MASGSVIKGSGALVIARMAGMLGGFMLFLLLTWRSKEVAGVFRTAVTFLVIMDALPLLGMQRWLAAEMGRHADLGWAIFRMASWFATGVAVLGGIAYAAIAYGGFYEADTSACLKVIALATVPSAINLCVTTALVGIGYSYHSGILSLAEMVVRSTVSIAIVLAGADVFWVVVVFAVTRWIVAGAGFALISAHLAHRPARIDRALIRSFAGQVPNLGISMIGFLAIRNTALLLLPWFRNEAEAGLYAAPFQLFDLLLLVPTVLTISTNYAFVESAKSSTSSLRRSTNELAYITATFIFPIAAVAGVLAGPIIELLFGAAYDDAIVPFRLLLLSAVLMALDQVFSLSMVTAGRYGLDRICIVVGATATLAITSLLSGPLGATGAAAGLLAGAVCMLGTRLHLMRDVLSYRALFGLLRHQATASIVASSGVWLALAMVGPVRLSMRRAEVLLGLVGGALYVAMLYWAGGVSKRRVSRVQAFMARRG